VGWLTRIQLLTGAGKGFFLHNHVQTSSKTYTAFYLMGFRGSFPRIKQPVHDIDQAPPSGDKGGSLFSQFLQANAGVLP
jgi:hypothetical protein